MKQERAFPWKGTLCGVGAAVLFGLSAPLAKRLLPDSSPLLLAALFYLGAAAGLSAAMRWRAPDEPDREARLRFSDAPALIAIIVLGGIIGPVLMLYGLGRVSGVSGALLLNLEAPFTVALAALVFGEHLGARVAAATMSIVAGALLLSYDGGKLHGELLGSLSIAGACLCWAIDNNLTQRLSLRDPFRIARIKAGSAGVCTLAIGLALGDALPRSAIVVAALFIGVFSYGVSILLDVYALRLLGAAREAALFATAPFAGAMAAIPILGERLDIDTGIAALLMAAGAGLLVRERHSHLHTHDALEHEHRHVHDAHHQHAHSDSVSTGEPHSHLHRHEPLVHDHPHVPDVHHRHSHGGEP